MIKSIVIGFILHLIGDYILQNDWMANNKTKSSLVAFVHASVYSIPFLLICGVQWWAIIYVSHFFIDRYRLAVYWIKLVNWNWESDNFGYDESKPIWMSLWLMIIIDNTFHIAINSLALYFGGTI